MGKDSILTNHVCPICSKDFISSQGLTCHITIAPYCHNSWLSVSNGVPIDNIVLPANATSIFQDPGDHSLDDADDNYHPIYATSIDGQDKSASDNDDVVPTNDDMEGIACFNSHLESPSDVIKGDSGIDVVGDTSPISHHVFPSIEPSTPGENTNGFTSGPSKSFPSNVEDLCLQDVANLIHEIGAPLSAFSKILAWVGHWQMWGHIFRLQSFLHMQHMWNNCHKNWNSTVSSTKWRQLSFLGVVLALSLCSTSHQCFIVFLMTLAVTITSNWLGAPISWPPSQD